MLASSLRSALLLCLCFLAIGSAWAVDPNSRITQYSHTAWRSSEGYFDSSPYALAQTRDGYLWIGSASGLQRFDGVRFVKFNSTSGVKLSGAVNALFTDRGGTLWIGTAAGLFRLTDGTLSTFKSSPAAIRQIAQDDAGTIWVVRAAMRAPGGALCKVAGAELQCLDPAHGFPLPLAKTLACDHQGNIWVGGTTSYIRWSPTSQTVYSPEAFKGNGEMAAIGAIGLAPDGHPLIGMVINGPGLGLQEMLDGKPHPYGPFAGFNPESIAVNAIRQDSQGATWVGTARGLIRLYNGLADRFGAADGLSGDNILDVLEDREGNIWVATTQGLDRLRDLPIKSFDEHEGLRIAFVSSLLADRSGRLWMQDGFNLSFLDPGIPTTIHPEIAMHKENYVSVIFQSSDGSIWTSQSESIFRSDRGNLQKIARPAGAPDHTTTRAFAEDSKHDIFALQGLTPDLWRIHDGVAERVITTPALTRSYTMTMDHHDVLWFSLADGKLGRLQGTDLQSLTVQPSGTPAPFRQLSVTPDDAVIGIGEGLFLIKDGKTAILGKSSGLPCEHMLSSTFDLKGNLWIATSCGTMKITREDWQRWRNDPKSIVTPLVLDTLDGNSWSSVPLQHAADLTPDGRVWFGTGGSLQMIEPEHLAVNKIQPPVHIEDISADGAAVDVTSSPRLPPLTRQIQIDYTATSLTVPQRVLFRYKLEGHDKDWQVVGTRRQAFYNDLKPGNYKFTVLACNNSGLWNEVGASTAFDIAPAWFQTQWFFVACTLLAALLLYSLYLLRVNQIQSRLQFRYEAQLAERTRLARDLHDTLLQTIQGTKLVAEEALRGSEDPKQLQSVVEKIHEWLSRAVVEGRAALTALRSGWEPQDLANRLQLAADQCCTGRGITVHCEVIGTPVQLTADVNEEVFRIAYEAIRNACAHSGGTSLELQLSYGRKLTLRVRDNGKGFDPDSLADRVSGHYGIEGMRERARQLGGSLVVSSTPGKGMEVSLTVSPG